MRLPELSLLIAFVGYSILNIAQAGQKIGLARWRRNAAAGWLIWLGATAGTSVAFFVILAAISLGSISLVGAMAGTGLASLAVFSHFVMKDRLDLRELIAVTTVAGGAALVGAFAEEAVVATTRVPMLWATLGAGAAAYTVAWVVTRKRSYTGAVIGGFSGFLGAYSQLFQEHGTSAVSISGGIGAFAVSLVANPITLVWAGLSVVSMIVLQFSYRHGRAIEIIPSFTGNFIAVPVIGGVVLFGQSLSPFQWAGVGLIALGAVVLGRGQDSTEGPGAPS